MIKRVAVAWVIVLRTLSSIDTGTIVWYTTLKHFSLLFVQKSYTTSFVVFSWVTILQQKSQISIALYRKYFLA
jgi:hypothetical protein